MVIFRDMNFHLKSLGTEMILEDKFWGPEDTFWEFKNIIIQGFKNIF